ncbi:MAG: hypothetical protein QGH15_14650 [Kiritimatiellia bacterium]|nr:hypothetical protein [Kiritimatiellia bacterium]
MTILNAVVEREGKRKLPCKVAFTIAAENDVKVNEIGAICEEEKIKITNCQLGCFA